MLFPVEFGLWLLVFIDFLESFALNLKFKLFIVCRDNTLGSFKFKLVDKFFFGAVELSIEYQVIIDTYILSSN